MTLRTYVTLRAAYLLVRRHLSSPRIRLLRHCDDRGQTTAEYALVIIGAAAVALLLLAWATDTGKISDLLNKIVSTVADMVN